jgi:hypothetical protein
VLYWFRDPDQATGILQLGAGDLTAIDWFASQNDIRSGSRNAMAQAAHNGWKADMLAGKVTLMAAADGADVTTLSAQSPSRQRPRLTTTEARAGVSLARSGHLPRPRDSGLDGRSDRAVRPDTT